MNRINPKKLLNSKWTAVTPQNKEKHFSVVEVEFEFEFDNDNTVVRCCIQAVMATKPVPINWLDLKNAELWLQGWK